MTIKQTAGRDALGDFAPNLHSSMTMCCSARCGREDRLSPSRPQRGDGCGPDGAGV